MQGTFYIITISREFGACGGTIGRAVADNLGYYYFDKDMILQTALQSGTLTLDKARNKYCTFYTNTTFGQADYYDLCLKSSTLGVENSIEMTCQAAL